MVIRRPKQNPLKEYCILNNLKYSFIKSQLDCGVPLEVAVKRKYVPYENVTETFDYMGGEYTPTELANSKHNVLGIDSRTIYDRLLRYGWDVYDALHTPIKHSHWTQLVYRGVMYNGLRDVCQKNNASLARVREHMRNGASLEEAISICQKPIRVTYEYHGTMCTPHQLFKHKDNIHHLSYQTLHYRIKKGYSNEDLFSPLMLDRSNGRMIQYQGKVYGSIARLCRELGIVNSARYLYGIKDPVLLNKAIELAIVDSKIIR